jgi:beta-mannanase
MKQKPALLCITLCLILVAVSAAQLPHDAAADTPPPTVIVYLPLVAKYSPARYTGVFLPLTSSATWATEVNNFVALTGQPHAMHLVSSGFGCVWADAVTDIRRYLNHVQSLGRMVLITWMPMDCANGGFGNVNTLNLKDILDGRWDTYMTQWANEIGALGYPMFIRWGHEMNIPSYVSWAGQNAFGADGKTPFNDSDALANQGCSLTNCFGDPNIADGPERYIAAYRRVHDLVKPRAPNLIWVWNPNARQWPLADQAPWNHYSNYYPGDTYVDWVGLDGYNWGDQSGNGYGRWVTFDEMFGVELNDLAQRYPTKPQMIPEIGAVEDPVDPNRKANFIRDAYQAARRYPKLSVMAWVQDNNFIDPFRYDGVPIRVDFRVNSSAVALTAYIQAIATWSSELPPRNP